MDLSSQLRTSLTSQNLPPPSSTFLTSIITARNPPPPLPSLLATAKARLTACDLTRGTALDTASLAAFPSNVLSLEAQETKLARAVHVQVLDVENLSLSRWEQVEEIEAIERGERTRGREIVRVSAEDDDQGEVVVEGQTQPLPPPPPSTQRPPQRRAAEEVRVAAKNATHRLVLQDHKGTKVFALELRRTDKIGVGKTNIGEKILLKAGTVVARGTVLLEPEKCVFLGGKVEAWQKTWAASRLERLKEEIGGNPQ